MKLLNQLVENYAKIEENNVLKIKTQDKHLQIYLERLSFKELNTIVSLLTDNHEKLSKQQKIDLIIDKLDQLILSFIDYLNLKHYLFIQQLIKLDGEIPYQDEYSGLYHLFHTYGFCFLVLKQNKKTIIMPEEIYYAFKVHLDEMKIKLIEQNDKIIQYIHGLIHLYGLIELDLVSEKVNLLIQTKLPHHKLYNLITFDVPVNFFYAIHEDYLASAFILDTIDFYLQKRETSNLDYYPYTDKEILNASNPDSISDNLIYTNYINQYMKKFNLSFDKANELIITYLYVLKEDISYQLLINLISAMISIQDIEYEFQTLSELNEIVPKWSLKGYSYNKLKIKNPLTLKRLVELARNGLFNRNSDINKP